MSSATNNAAQNSANQTNQEAKQTGAENTGETWTAPESAFADMLRESSKTIKEVVDADQDSVCNVCRSDEADEGNPFVFCDRCGICVHRECYGTPLTVKIPEDEWLCDRCEQNAQDEMCALCPVRYGAMKRTTDWRWCHLSCAMWIPEVFFRGADGREPIDLSQIPGHRWENDCCHCGSNYGAKMICGHKDCGRTFHITCGLLNNIFLEYKVVRNAADVIVALCFEHAKKWQSKKKGR